MINKIVISVDGSEGAERAVAFAASIASKAQAAIVLIHVLLRSVPNGEMREIACRLGFLDSVRDEMEKSMVPKLAAARAGAGVAIYDVLDDTLKLFGNRILDHAAALITDKTLSISKQIADDDPATAILHCIEKEQADMVVVASRGLGPMVGLIVGSVSQKLVQSAPCACLIVK